MVIFGGFKRFSKKMCFGGTPWYPPTLCAPCYCSYWLIGRHCNYCRRYDITFWPGETCNTWAMTMIIIIVNDVTKSFKPNLQRDLLYNLQLRCWQIFLAKKLKSPFTFYVLKRFHKIASFRSLLKAMCCFATLRVFFEWKLSGLAASAVISGSVWVRKDLTKYSSLSLMRDLKCNPKYREQSFRIYALCKVSL